MSWTVSFSRRYPDGTVGGGSEVLPSEQTALDFFWFLSTNPLGSDAAGRTFSAAGLTCQRSIERTGGADGQVRTSRAA